MKWIVVSLFGVMSLPGYAEEKKQLPKHFLEWTSRVAKAGENQLSILGPYSGQVNSKKKIGEILTPSELCRLKLEFSYGLSGLGNPVASAKDEIFRYSVAFSEGSAPALVQINFVYLEKINTPVSYGIASLSKGWSVSHFVSEGMIVVSGDGCDFAFPLNAPTEGFVKTK